MSEPKPTGRPSKYTLELADVICEKLMSGESLRAICRLPTMPDASTIFRWLEDDTAFASKYARAREVQAQLKFDELQEIADDGTNDYMARNDPDNPGYQANGEHIQRSKLRTEILRWRLSKLLPKKYGDRIVTEHTGPNGGPVQTVSLITNDPIEAARQYSRIMTDGE